MKNRPLSLILIFCIVAGCGYTTRSMIATTYRTIYITPFLNKIDITRETDAGSRYKIYRPGLETDITKAVVNKYLFDGNLRPTKEELADVVLKGELVEFRKDPLRYNDDNDEIAEYRMNILVNIALWDTKEDKLVWEEKNFTGDYTYFTTASTTPSATKKTDAQAVPEAINDLARRIVERTVEQW
ncbi:MAG: hypothetical protein JW788_06760 [Candidatus Omnitrophica bacterium]|nr:hypothetical protein [Candidatus Omnitrophota bacterium]